jgi:GcrA cell cycle regulator
VLGGLNYGGPDRPEPDFPTFEPDLFIPESKRKGLIDLEPTDCHWPIGDPVEIGFHFCGKVKIMGKPYCEFHCNRAYLAPSVSRVRSFEPVESETIQDQPSVKVGAELIDG